MTPREKNLTGWLSVAISALVALGGVFVYAESKSKEVTEIKTRLTDEIKRLDGKDTDVVQRLDRIERKVDMVLARGNHR